MILGKGMKVLSNFGGIIGTGLIIFNYFYPNSISRNAGTVAMGASTMLSRVDILVNVGYGEELDNDSSRNTICETGSMIQVYKYINNIQYINKCKCDFVNEEMGVLNKKGGRFLNKLYINNEEFREEIINFVKDKKEIDLDLILDKRCKTNTINTLGNKYLAECITSKDNTKDLIEIMAKYYPVKD